MTSVHEPVGTVWQSLVPTASVLVPRTRSYLGLLTLITELRVLQRAHVRPDGLYATADAAHRVVTALREHTAAASDRGAALLAGWARQSLFAHPAVLRDTHTRWSRGIPEALLDQCVQATGRALAELEGPWTLDAFLDDPIGKAPHLVTGSPLTAPVRLDLALGRPSYPVTPDRIDRAHRTVADLVDQSSSSARSGDAAALPPGVRRALGEVDEAYPMFLTDALALVGLAADRLARVDGRPVAPELTAHVLSLHHRAAAARHPDAIPTTTVTVAGLAITHLPAAPGREVQVEIDAAGSTAVLTSAQLVPVLRTLLRPPDELVTALGLLHAARPAGVRDREVGPAGDGVAGSDAETGDPGPDTASLVLGEQREHHHPTPATTPES
ncbi:hypothetical protein [Saccharothrix sp.]|uniref:hypothetical protein n=1 Tax=Saccharothrix sp. TaxID=1873460 RepID=UPI002810E8A1|nr:hypothetical protein [Saccharothrix sp.]